MEASEQGQGPGQDAPPQGPAQEPAPGTESPPAGPPQEGQEGGEEPVQGDQGEPAPIEQSDAEVGALPDGSVRQSAPDPARQSGVPLEEDREAGVQPGEARPPEFAGDQPNKAPSAEAGVGAPAQS